MTVQGQLQGKDLKIAVITSRFNQSITEKLEQGALSRLKDLGVSENNIFVYRVPGAIEVPFAAKMILKKEIVDGIVALGCVIRGETSHFDYVCKSAERGLSQLQLKTKIPIGFGILTTENEDQALARSGGSKGNKGAEAAEVTIEMINLKKQILNA